jgi:hypothetical protein
VPVIPASLGSIKQEDCSPGWPWQNVKYYFKNNQSKKSWRHGSSGGAQSFEFNPPVLPTPSYFSKKKGSFFSWNFNL